MTMSKSIYKDFGGVHAPIITVRVETGNLITGKDLVRIHWACNGENSIANALEFHRAFDAALAYARKEAAKLGLRIDE
jgi:hypothetical protein